MSLYSSPYYDTGSSSELPIAAPPPPRLGGDSYHNYYRDKDNDSNSTDSSGQLQQSMHGIPDNESFIVWLGFFIFFLLCYFMVWCLGGGRVQMQRNEHGRITSVRLVSPPTSNDCLTRRQVLDLPTIIYDSSGDVEASFPCASATKIEMGLPKDAQETDDDEADETINKDPSFEIHDNEDAVGRIAEEASPIPVAVNTAAASHPLPHPIPVKKVSSKPDNCITCRSKNTTCPICIEDFMKGEELRILPRCGHLMHTECLLPWLCEKHGLCPLCKRPVVVSDAPSTLEQHREVLRDRERELQQEQERQRQWRRRQFHRHPRYAGAIFDDDEIEVGRRRHR
jgi:hypothetical protein